MKPFIEHQSRTEDDEKEILDDKIKGIKYYVKGYSLNNGTIVFRTVDSDGAQTQNVLDISIQDIIDYRDEIHPGMAVIKPYEEDAINSFYLTLPTIRLSSHTLFINGDAVVYKDIMPEKPNQFFSFALAKSEETIAPNGKTTGSLNFYLSNEKAVMDQRYKYGNDSRFTMLERMYESGKDTLPSLQEMENHQFVMNG